MYCSKLAAFLMGQFARWLAVKMLLQRELEILAWLRANKLR
jgi:hypothetical protein